MSDIEHGAGAIVISTTLIRNMYWRRNLFRWRRGRRGATKSWGRDKEMERRTKLYQEKKNRENLGRAEEMERKTKLYQGKIHIKKLSPKFSLIFE